MKRVLSILACSAILLAGCGDKEKSVEVKPVGFQPEDRCHLCGMVIDHYEGPKAQVFIRGETEAIKFCSLRDAFTFALQPENARRLSAFFAHDMGKTDWAKPTDAALTKADSLQYVYGSRLFGAMGVEPVPFSNTAKARAFIETNGGRLVPYAGVTLKLLEEN